MRFKSARWMMERHRQAQVRTRYWQRHSCDRWPHWLKELQTEINYWLTATSRKRHIAPFNKLENGRKRRAQRRFKIKEREACYDDPCT